MDELWTSLQQSDSDAVLDRLLKGLRTGAHFVPAERARNILYAVEIQYLYALIGNPRRLLRKVTRRKIQIRIKQGRRRIARRLRAWDARQANLMKIMSEEFSE